jgi:SAM-dependent methyltransferase
VPYNEFYRGHFTGVPAQIVQAAVPWYRKLSIRYVNYIYMPMLFERKQRGAAGGRKKTVQGKLPKVGFEFILKQLRKWVVSLQAPEQETTWSHYDAIRNYNEQEIEQKHRFLEAVIREEKPKTLWDIGCNTGEFSLVSLEAGADYVVGIEMDHGALAQAFEQSQTVGDKFLPLYQNLLNPSANMGWAQKERMGIQERGDADMIVALAVLHHLVIGGNVPLKSAVEYLTERAASGVIEWVPKEDGMVQALLANREDIFPHYDEEMFRQLLEERVTIISEEQISASGRKLFYYKRQA